MSEKAQIINLVQLLDIIINFADHVLYGLSLLDHNI